MKIEKERLLELLETGKITEHLYENVELKRSWSREHGEKASMLCNGNPNGTNFLIIGIEDNGKFSNHDEGWLKKNLEQLSQQFNSDLDPSIALTDVTSLVIEKSHIIIVTLSNQGVVVKWREEAFIGSGTTKRKLTPPEILELGLKLPGLQDLTKKPASFVPLAGLVTEAALILKEESTNNLLEKYNLKNLGGQILFGKTPYRVVKYSSSGGITSNETRYGLLGLLSPSFYKEVRSYYSDHSFERLKITDALLREALGNCVGHAAYHENSGEIIVELFQDKIQFTNLAYNEYTSLANKWFSSAHKSPNPFLMEAMRLLNLVDELGRGKKKILSECLCNGFAAPYITITDAGRHKRWSLKIDFSHASDKHKKAFDSIRTQYNLEKSLIAYSLLLWNQKPFSEIKGYFDSHEASIAIEIISDFRGPIFYWKERDRLIPHRWMRILLEEGKSSKGLTPIEKEDLYKALNEFQNKYHGGYVTPKELREIAHLSETSSDKTLSSKILSGWESEGRLEKVKKGLYKFPKDADQITEKARDEIEDAFRNTL